MLEPRIETIKKKKLIGLQIRMNLANDRTSELWRSFIQRKDEIKNRVNTDRYSIQVYDPAIDIKSFTPQIEFNKWAAVEVTDMNAIPQGMKSIIIEDGHYAVFLHRGAAHTFAKTYSYIFEVWLPNPTYQLDQRPHFEIMKQGYNPFDENAEEEVWIPIKTK